MYSKIIIIYKRIWPINDFALCTNICYHSLIGKMFPINGIRKYKKRLYRLSISKLFVRSSFIIKKRHIKQIV